MQYGKYRLESTLLHCSFICFDSNHSTMGHFNAFMNDSDLFRLFIFLICKRISQLIFTHDISLFVYFNAFEKQHSLLLMIDDMIFDIAKQILSSLTLARFKLIKNNLIFLSMFDEMMNQYKFSVPLS